MNVWHFLHSSLTMPSCSMLTVLHASLIACVPHLSLSFSLFFFLFLSFSLLFPFCICFLYVSAFNKNKISSVILLLLCVCVFCTVYVGSFFHFNLLYFRFLYCGNVNTTYKELNGKILCSLSLYVPLSLSLIFFLIPHFREQQPAIACWPNFVPFVSCSHPHTFDIASDAVGRRQFVLLQFLLFLIVFVRCRQNLPADVAMHTNIHHTHTQDGHIARVLN